MQYTHNQCRSTSSDGALGKFLIIVAVGPLADFQIGQERRSDLGCFGPMHMDVRSNPHFRSEQR